MYEKNIHKPYSINLRQFQETLIYQSIFLAESFIIKNNSLEEYLLETPSKVYIISGGLRGIPRVSRSLDPLTLAYAVYRGLYWLVNGVDFYNKVNYYRKEALNTRKENMGNYSLDLICKGIFNEDHCDLSEKIKDIVKHFYNLGFLVALPSASHNGGKAPIDDSTASPFYWYIERKNVDNLLVKNNPIILDEHNLDHYNAFVYIKNTVKNEVFREILLKASEKIDDEFKRIFGESIKTYFKTIHMEILRLVENASPLPLRNAIARVIPLPLVIDLPPATVTMELDTNRHSVEELSGLIESFYSRKLDIERIEKRKDIEEKINGIREVIINSLKKEKINYFDEYQWSIIKRYLENDFSTNKNNLVILSAPTGAGKTIIFMLITILDRITDKLIGHDSNKTLIIYPRKSLAYQQLKRIVNFLYHVNDGLKKLNLEPIRITLRDNESLTKNSYKQNLERNNNMDALRHLILPDNKKVEHHIASINGKECYESDPMWIMDVKEDLPICGNRNKCALEAADVIITNYAMAFKIFLDAKKIQVDNATNPNNRVISKVKQVILDEAHIYMNEDRLYKVSPIVLSILKDSKKTNQVLDIVISSASLSNLDLIPSKAYLGNIVGVVKKSGSEKENLYSYLSSIIGIDVKEDYFNIIYEDYSSTNYSVISKGGKWKGPVKITYWSTALTMPDRKSSTALEESLVSIMHVMEALRKRNGNRLKATTLAFIDSKDELLRIVDYLTNRIILETGDHYDRVLLAGIKKGRKQQKIEDSIKLIKNEIENRINTGVLNAIWDLDRSQINQKLNFSRFHALSPYLGENEYLKLKSSHGDWEKVLHDIVGNWLENIDEAAKVIQKRKVFRMDNANEIIKDLCDKRLRLIYAVHHGDLHVSRVEIDRYIADGEPSLILSTSTLEVGLDIPSIFTVIQYSQDASAGSPLQRVGRSGRRFDSKLISHGILILKNTEEDVRLMDEKRAMKYLFSTSYKMYNPLMKNPEALAKIIITLLFHGLIKPYLYDSQLNLECLKELERKINEYYNMKNKITKKVMDILIIQEDGASLLNKKITDLIEHWFNDFISFLDINIDTISNRKNKRYDILNAKDYLESIRGISNKKIEWIKKYELSAIDPEINNSLSRDYPVLAIKNLTDSFLKKLNIGDDIGINIKRVIDLLFPMEKEGEMNVSGLILLQILWDIQDRLTRININDSESEKVIANDNLWKIIRSMYVVVLDSLMRNNVDLSCSNYIKTVSSLIYPGILSEIGEDFNKPKVRHITYNLGDQ
ncbi:MAG: DEAD/DEAH box helicase [Caldisphaeraceae archaeon]|nr:DEAD/DEAH box helicase [Caldisphaeraceae archaeon]